MSRREKQQQQTGRFREAADGPDLNSPQFDSLDSFSAQQGIAPEALRKVFEIERRFHIDILREEDAGRRKEMYRTLYGQVHELLGQEVVSKDRIVRRFARELRGKSVLDVGCGSGEFLRSVARLLPHGKLSGVDVSADAAERLGREGIEFIEGDIIDFHVRTRFDVVFADNVVEHLAPADLPAHLASVRGALTESGTYIIVMPHRSFGPSDITRVLDCSYRNRVPAMGSHLNESTYGEMLKALRAAGFASFRCVPPWICRILPELRVTPQVCMGLESATSVRVLHALRLRFPISLICTSGMES